MLSLAKCVDFPAELNEVMAKVKNLEPDESLENALLFPGDTVDVEPLMIQSKTEALEDGEEMETKNRKRIAPVRVGDGLVQMKDKLIVCKPGILRRHVRTNKVWIQNSQKRVSPSKLALKFVWRSLENKLIIVFF